MPHAQVLEKSALGLRLSCPSCSQELRPAQRHDDFAILRCHCREVAMLDGVCMADDGAVQTRLLEALRANDLRSARRIMLGSHARKARFLESLGIRTTFQRFVRHRFISQAVDKLRLYSLLDKLPFKRIGQTIRAAAQWNLYARHRFASAPMLANTALLGLLEGREGFVLDAPCGMGHLSFLISKLFPPQRLVCMDLSAPYAYSTRRFFAPDAAAAIVHDMNHPLPLASGQFGLIICADAFHYVENREGLAREFMRITRDDGIVVLAHVHNRLHQTQYAGFPLSPMEYARLFDGWHVRVVPEKELIDAYFNEKPLDLREPFTPQAAEPHQMLHVLASKSPDAFKLVPSVRSRLIEKASNPRVNEIYRVYRNNGHFIFDRRIPAGLQAEYDSYPEFLPARLTIDAAQVSNGNGQLRFTNQRQLLKQHVLLDVPPDF